jgi:hypothetical protein
MEQSTSGWCVSYYEYGLQVGRKDFAKELNAREYLKTLLTSENCNQPQHLISRPRRQPGSV